MILIFLQINKNCAKKRVFKIAASSFFIAKPRLSQARALLCRKFGKDKVTLIFTLPLHFLSSHPRLFIS